MSIDDGGVLTGGKTKGCHYQLGADGQAHLVSVSSHETEGGATMWDYYACGCLQALITRWPIEREDDTELVAEWAGKYADAMIAERNKRR